MREERGGLFLVPIKCKSFQQYLRRKAVLLHTSQRYFGQRSLTKGCTLVFNYAEQSHSLLFSSFSCSCLRTPFILRKPVVLCWFFTVVTKTIQTAYCHQERELRGLEKYEDSVTLTQVPVTLQLWCDGLLPQGMPSGGNQTMWFCSVSMRSV